MVSFSFYCRFLPAKLKSRFLLPISSRQIDESISIADFFQPSIIHPASLQPPTTYLSTDRRPPPTTINSAPPSLTVSLSSSCLFPISLKTTRNRHRPKTERSVISAWSMLFRRQYHRHHHQYHQHHRTGVPSNEDVTIINGGDDDDDDDE